MLQSNGDAGPPCRVPVTSGRTCPSCITLARSSDKTPWSHTRSSTARSNSSCGIAEKQSAKAIREWARAHGYQLADWDRIPTDVIAGYEEAQAETNKPKAK